jgi:zinc/manganese transport system substrate-binding protein
MDSDMSLHRNVITWITFALALFAFATAQAQAPRLKVVASFSILADLARNVGGDRVEVFALVGPDGDAHMFRPSPADAKRLGEAKLILVNGLAFEGWIDRLVKTARATAPVVVASKGIIPRKDEEEGHGGEDPHAWQSVTNVRTYVENIRDGLIAADPEGASLYRANAERYLATLAALEEEIRAAIDKIPRSQRRIITTHDAFGYFGDAYGLEFIAPEGVSTESEASARDVGKIIRQIKSEKIPAVFLENVSDPRLTKRIAAESGARIGGTLFSDALSPPDGPAPTYIDMMRHNTKEIVTALAP